MSIRRGFRKAEAIAPWPAIAQWPGISVLLPLRTDPLTRITGR